MLTRIHGKLSFECDVCGSTLETETRDFTEAKDALDVAGWRARKIGSEWIHYCPDCGEEGRRKNGARQLI